ALPLPPVERLGRAHLLGSERGPPSELERFVVAMLFFVQRAEVAPGVGGGSTIAGRRRDGLAQRRRGLQGQRVSRLRQGPTQGLVGEGDADEGEADLVGGSRRAKRADGGVERRLGLRRSARALEHGGGVRQRPARERRPAGLLGERRALPVGGQRFGVPLLRHEHVAEIVQQRGGEAAVAAVQLAMASSKLPRLNAWRPWLKLLSAGGGSAANT